MMDDDLYDVAVRAMRLRGWQWMPGMLTTDGRRYIRQIDCGHCAWFCAQPDDGCAANPATLFVAHLHDAATGGCMLDLLDKGTSAVRVDSNRRWLVMSNELAESGVTLGEACARLAVRQGYWQSGGSDGAA